MCGTATTTVQEWRKNGECCGICGNTTHRDECTRCRSICAGSESSRACGALAAYRTTGRVAFPERVAQPIERNTGDERGRAAQKTAEPKKKKPKPRPPMSDSDDNPFAIAWRRYRGSLAKYAVFLGRSHRAELFSFLIIELFGCVAASLIGAVPVLLVVTVMPAWALVVRRLHDINRSGHWLWLVVCWPIAMLVLPVMLLWPGTKGPNRYGEPPE